MINIGKFLKISRLARKHSLEDVEKATKIKKSLIAGLEDQKWNELPEFPVISGFVKNLASFYKVDKNHAIALLRRDYPPTRLNITPKPDVQKGFRWSPRLTFISGVIFIITVLTGYLVYQYFTFNTPPKITITSPSENEIIYESPVTITGKVDSGATVRVNNQPAIVDDEGNFTAEVQITQTTEFEIISESRNGQSTTITKTVIFDPN